MVLPLPLEVPVLAAIAFAVAVGFGIVAPVIPLYARELGVGATLAGAVVSVFAGMRLVSGLLGGRLVDRFSERSVLTAGLLSPLVAVPEVEMNLKLTSTTFTHDGEIPTRHTCEGEDVSPPLGWQGAPAETKSFVLIVDDPDAPDPEKPKMTWVHWVLFNIPPGARGLPGEISPDAALENGARHGTNDFGRLGYGGPCPPGGTHRYFFKLYALDTRLDLASGITKAQLVDAMEGHVLAEAQLMGKYKR